MTDNDKIEIFKVQRAVVGEDAILIYNKDRTILGQIPNNGKLDKLFDKDFKIYVEGRLSKDGIFEVIRKVGRQDW